MDSGEEKNMLLNKLLGSSQVRTKGGHLKFELHAGVGPSAISTCRNGFRQAYGVFKYQLEQLVSSVDAGYGWCW